MFILHFKKDVFKSLENSRDDRITTITFINVFLRIITSEHTEENIVVHRYCKIYVRYKSI